MWQIIFGLWWSMDNNKVFILFPVASYSYPRPTSVSELLACFLATREERLQAEWVPKWMYNVGQFSRKSLLQPHWMDQTFSTAIWGAARGWWGECLCLSWSFPLLPEAGQLPIGSCKKFGHYCCSPGPCVFMLFVSLKAWQFILTPASSA